MGSCTLLKQTSRRHRAPSVKLKSLLLRVSESRSEGKHWRWCGGDKWMRLSTTSWQKSLDCRLWALGDVSSQKSAGRVTPNCVSKSGSCTSDNFILKVPEVGCWLAVQKQGRTCDIAAADDSCSDQKMMEFRTQRKAAKVKSRLSILDFHSSGSGLFRELLCRSPLEAVKGRKSSSG